MTSRQPETMRGAADHGETPDAGPRGAADHGETPDAGPRGAAAQYWALLLPLSLLIILGLAGLRGVVTKPRWNGPLQHDGVVIGLVLEVALGVLLVITIRRRNAGLRSGRVNAVAAKLQAVLIFVLGVGMAAVAVILVIAHHLLVPPGAAPASPGQPVPKTTPSTSRPLPRSRHPYSFHVPLAVVLYALLIALLLAGIVLSVLWARRLRPAVERRGDDFIAEDPEDLREAVESGRSALRTVDDARAAIIACYLAMERSLAERGAARDVADTPGELLARAAQSGLVPGTAAPRLTALFYEARFSSHPLDHGQRDAAEQALDELATEVGAAGT